MPNRIELEGHAGVVQTAKIRAAASDNATVLKAGPGRVYGGTIFNNAGTTRYIKWYDQATTPTASDVPVFTVQLATLGAANAIVSNVVYGTQFSNGIAYRITTGAAESDNTATSANDVAGMVVFS